jgi:hypothetical protein
LRVAIDRTVTVSVLVDVVAVKSVETSVDVSALVVNAEVVNVIVESEIVVVTEVSGAMGYFKEQKDSIGR